MAEFSSLVVTDDGRKLIMKVLETSSTVRFTRIAVSDREYTVSEFRDMTALSGIRQESAVSEVETENTDAVRIHAVVPNTDISEGYFIKAVGLYAEHPESGEILYGVAAEISENGCWVPPFRNRTVSNIYFNLSVSVGNAENVLLQIDPAAVVTVRQLEKVLHPEYPEAGELAEPESGESFFLILGKMKKAVAALISHIGNRNNPHGVTTEQIGLGNVDNTHDMDKPVSSAMLDALSENHEQLTDYTDKAVADLNSSLNTALANNYYNKIKVNELISGINDSLKDTSSWTGEWYPGHCITGWGFIVIIPWRTKGRKIGISRIRAFTGAGWTTNLTVSYIKTYPGCFAITCGETPEMTGGCTYVAEISFSVS